MGRKINNFLKDSFETGVIRKLKTGLEYDIIVDEIGVDRGENVNPKLVLSNEAEQCLVSIEKHPKVQEGTTFDTYRLNCMLSFIADNCEIFLAHWKHELDLADLQYFCINISKK